MKVDFRPMTLVPDRPLAGRFDRVADVEESVQHFPIHPGPVILHSELEDRDLLVPPFDSPTTDLDFRCFVIVSVCDCLANRFVVVFEVVCQLRKLGSRVYCRLVFFGAKFVHH